MQPFNLLDEPWIPCLYRNGKPSRLSIRETLAQAGTIRQIAASNPMDRVAILRFLLALLYWCKGNPPSSTDAAFGDSFPADWFAKLEAYRDCFNLLGEGKRFYQYRGERETPLAANYLMHEIPTGTNFWHFRHASDGVDGLCPACCAMGLLRLPLFSTQGGSGNSPGINAKPPLYMLPIGKSLLDTLRLSWQEVPRLGTPAWENPGLQLPKTGEVSLLTGLTWLPRRVWLGDPQDSEASCISCGSKERLITSTIFAGLGSAKAESRVWRDPHVLYQTPARGKVTPLYARDALRDQGGAAGQWASIITAMLKQRRTSHESDLVKGDKTAAEVGSHVLVVGFSTDKAKYFEVTGRLLPSSVVSLDPDILAELVNQWEGYSSAFVARLRPQGEKRLLHQRKHPEIASMIAGVRPHVEAEVSSSVGDLLTEGDAAWERAAQEYRPMMETIARSLAPGFTTAGIQRRKQIAGALPDMTMTKLAKRDPKQKGGDV